MLGPGRLLGQGLVQVPAGPACCPALCLQAMSMHSSYKIARGPNCGGFFLTTAWPAITSYQMSPEVLQDSS